MISFNGSWPTTSSLKWPFESDAVPKVVPIQKTLAPGKGDLVFLVPENSKTLPSINGT